MGRMQAWRIGAIIGLLAALAAGVWFYTGIVRNAEYVDVTSGRGPPSQRLEINLPHGPGPFPVVVFAHGGAFAFGDKPPRSAVSATMWRR